MEATTEGVHSFFKLSLQKRLSPEKFKVLFRAYHVKHDSIQGRRLVDAVLHSLPKSTLTDPRIPLYFSELLYMQIIRAADIMWSLLPQPTDQSADGQQHYYDPNMLEVQNGPGLGLAASLVQMLTSEVSKGLLKTEHEVLTTLKSIMPWMSLFPGSLALGFFVNTLISTDIAQMVLPQQPTGSSRKKFGQSLALLVSHMMQHDMQLATTLDFWQRQYNLTGSEIEQQPDTDLDTAKIGSLTFQQSVLSAPPVNTRVGAYIYLNALLYDRPLFDDQKVMSYFGSRYKDDVTTLVIDLILASFDVLANAKYRSEPGETLVLLRSFLVNKVPSFLLNYAPMLFEPMNVEYCIGQAFSRIDSNTFPSFSQMFDSVGSSSSLSEARIEFLIACALHQLIPEQSIEILLGEDPMQSMPTTGRHEKHQLVAQCTSSPTRIEELVKELESMEGNAGEIAAALVEIMQSLCASKDTMTLKLVCNALSRRPATLDVLLLFSSTREILKPLCETLDAWQMHEDQGEHQPVYDEFGSILLLVMLVHQRFDLGQSELGVSSSDSFVVKYMTKSPLAKSLEDLSEKENKMLGAWIRGLFNDDEGINDELMATSSPGDFHLVVATLLDQSLKACQSGCLTMSTLKGGLEYLLEPFLLPSLVAGLTWFARVVWESTEYPPKLDYIMPALTALLKPRSIAADASALHSALLSIVAKPLHESLTCALSRNSQRSDIKPLLDVLSRYGDKQRRRAGAVGELESWSSTSGGGLQLALRHTLQSLILWERVASARMSPPRYTHQQITIAVQILGAKAVLDVLIDELMSHITVGGMLDSEPALEIVAVVILSTQISPNGLPTEQFRLSLTDALQAEIDNILELSKKDHSRAAVIVRLQRRIEALVGPPLQEADNVAGMTDPMATGVAHGTEVLPAGDIDDVLGQANEQAAAMDLMAGGTGDFMNLT